MKTLVVKSATILANVLPMDVKKSFYHLGPLTKWIRMILNKNLPQGFSQNTIAGGILAGHPFLLDMQSEKDYWLGTYETMMLEIIQKLVKPGWVVYDVGANVGYLTVLFAKLVGETGLVYAFEPYPANVQRLKNNVELNHYTERVQVFQSAVGKREGTVDFYIGASDDTGKIEGIISEKEKMNGEKISVPCIALDEFIIQAGNRPPQLVKMDIEGAEVLAMQGMLDLVWKVKPVLLIEIHGLAAAESVWTHLTKADYWIYRVGNDGKPINKVEELRRKDYILGLPCR